MPIVIEAMAIPTFTVFICQLTILSLVKANTIAKLPNEKVQNILIKKGISMDIADLKSLSLESLEILKRIIDLILRFY